MIGVAATAIAVGCSGPDMFGIRQNQMVPMTAQPGGLGSLMAKQQFQQELMKNPDLPAWHAQRENMALAVGDWVFDKEFDRVFDSMVTALATLGCLVNNMERVSGYLTATLPQLPPEQQEALRKESLAQYAQAKGYPRPCSRSRVRTT